MTNDELEPGNPYSNPWNWRAAWSGEVDGLGGPMSLEHGDLLTLNGTGQVLMEYIGPK